MNCFDFITFLLSFSKLYFLLQGTAKLIDKNKDSDASMYGNNFRVAERHQGSKVRKNDGALILKQGSK
jgi:hypothetical protein